MRPTVSERDQLRQELLYDGIIEPVNMSRIDSQVRCVMPKASTEQRQQAAVEAIRSLVDDGLVEPGFPGQDGEFVVEALGDTLAEVDDKYLGHYERPSAWMWCAWLKLTDKGWAAATSTPEGQRVAEHERERLESLHGKSPAE
jgi:hypothetical protein